MIAKQLMDTFESLTALTKTGFTNSHFEVNEKIYFRNGYGVSVVKGSGTYGHEQGLYELALIDWGNNIVYDKGVTEDGVSGYLTKNDVKELIATYSNNEQLSFPAEFKGQQQPLNRSFGEIRLNFI